MVKRLLLFVSMVFLVIGSIWLAGLSLWHDEMMVTNDCAISASETECSETSAHTLHVLAHRINGLVSGSLLPNTHNLLAQLLLAAGVVGLALIILTDPLLIAPLRRLTRFRELALLRAQQRFRAWRITIQELHPLITY